jgi:transcriptional regulator with XRE-family HTH domain
METAPGRCGAGGPGKVILLTTDATPQPTSAGIFAANVFQLRNARGWSQEKLGELFNPGAAKPAATVNLVEAGRQTGLDTVDRMAQVFGRTPTEMITPLPCEWCGGTPPEGYACIECDSSTPRQARQAAMA